MGYEGTELLQTAAGYPSRKLYKLMYMEDLPNLWL